jgi:hypothetical protein
MRLPILPLVLAPLVCAAPAAELIEVVPAMPGGIAVFVLMLRFPDADARRQADRAARGRCDTEGGKVHFVRSALVNGSFRYGQKGVYLYDCLAGRGSRRR